MAEVAEESTHVWSHQARIVLFLSAMRHFRDALHERGFTVHYRELDDPNNAGSLRKELMATVSRLCPQRLIVAEPGEWRVAQILNETARALGLDLEIRPDRHFLCSREEFARHAKGRKQLRMEFFYRRNAPPAPGVDGRPRACRRRVELRCGKPPELRPVRPRLGSAPDHVSAGCDDPCGVWVVRRTFSKHPGNLDKFDWPVTRPEAQRALADFIANRLPTLRRL